VVRPDETPAQLRSRFEVMTGPLTTPAPPPLSSSDVLGYGPVGEELDAGKLDLIWGDARVFADHPDKPFDVEPDGALAQTSVAFNFFETLRTARSEVIISSPYFVPGPVSLEMLQAMRSRGVKVIVLTNSLASTDEPIVHVGYSRYRETLLKMGVELYELSASRLKDNERQYLFGKSLGRLHAKLAVIDGEQVFIGTMNLDPRSATINTELGSITRSATLAGELRHLIDIDRLQSAYRLRLNAEGRCCEWLSIDGEKEIILTKEPDSTPWQRLKNWLLSPLVPEEQL
jgi:putative cardiolipin synthase